MSAAPRTQDVKNMAHNPWLSIWTSPRATIAKIAEENPNKSLWLLSAIYGFCSLLNVFQSASLGREIGNVGLVILAVVLAPLWGYASFSIWSAFVTVVGKWLRGGGTFKTIRSAYAWSCVPITLNIPLWLLMVILFGHQLFLNFPDGHLLSYGQIMFLFVILIIKVIVAVWSLIIYLNALAEVQHFSLLRAILNVVIAGLILSIILFVVWSLFVRFVF